jgi:hypothetical protein
MGDISVFLDKAIVPTEVDLPKFLRSTYELWIQIQEFVLRKYPEGLKEWNFPGKKYGWSYRIKDKKRAIIYFLPREKYFKVAFVFGQKAYDIIMDSDISIEIKKDLEKAKKYAEGRGIRIDIFNDSKILDVQKLVEIKMAN